MFLTQMEQTLITGHVRSALCTLPLLEQPIIEFVFLAYLKCKAIFFVFSPLCYATY